MQNLLDKDSVKRVQEVISEFDPKIKVIALNAAARTAREAAFFLKCEVGAIVKSLLFKAEGNFLICLIAGDKKCSLNKLKKILNKKDICMANPEEVKRITGFSIGGVSPVAHTRNIDILIDSSLNRFKIIFAAAGHPNCVFKISYSDLIKITKGFEKNISQ